MNAISYSAIRANLAKAIDSVCQNHDPVIITRKNHNNAVLMSLDDFESWQETVYLLKNPDNAKRLKDSIEQLKKGKAKKRDIIECSI